MIGATNASPNGPSVNELVSPAAQIAVPEEALLVKSLRRSRSPLFQALSRIEL
jgi:hypothetical protein